MSDPWPLAGRARNEFADLVESLAPEQLASETWCSGWTPNDVLAHLVWLVEMTPETMMASVEQASGDFHLSMRNEAARIAKRPQVELIATLRTRGGMVSAVPGTPEAGILTDVAIHTQDVRRSLGLPGRLDAETVGTGLDMLTTHPNAAYLIDVSVLEGLRFVATDFAWSSGDGPLIEGTGEAILMAVAGRPTLDELTGDGAATLRSRVS